MMRESCSDVSVGEVDGVYRIYYSDGYRGGSTEPIRFCPMCGEPFPYNPHDSLESIKEDVTLSVCRYAKKRGFGHGKRDSDEEAICNRCEWSQQKCNLKMRMDVADRLGKLINEETER